jgi:hypothetical protein
MEYVDRLNFSRVPFFEILPCGVLKAEQLLSELALDSLDKRP